MQASRQHDGGFTRIELLIVIVILATLIAIVAMGVAQFRGTSVTSACEADEKIVRQAAEAFAVQRGTFPANLADLSSAGYVTDPPAGVTYTFDAGTKTVAQDTCNL